jgi:hypothetical protein
MATVANVIATEGNAKAMIGTIFLQYCAYSIFYLLDELNDIPQEHYKPLTAD